jgi:hypothetical protein
MRTYQSTQSIFSFLMLTLFLITISCSTKREEYIPYVSVDFTVDLNLFNDLTIPNSSMIYHNVGYGGVIVYCWNYDSSVPGNSIYYAYDATCTFEVNDSCAVLSSGNNNLGECPCCHTQYDFSNGGYPIPNTGEALYPLNSYNVFIANNKLHIQN